MRRGVGSREVKKPKMKKLIALAIAGMMLLPVAAIAQTGPSYEQVAEKRAWGTVSNLETISKLLSILFGTQGERNAAHLGMWAANASQANYSSNLTSTYVIEIEKDTASKNKVATGIAALGRNASQIQCTNTSTYAGTTQTFSVTGNCKTDSGAGGTSRLSRVSHDTIVNNQSARDRARDAIGDIIRDGITAFVLTQKGQVGAIDPWS